MKKLILLLLSISIILSLTITAAPLTLAASAVSVTESGGWLETAYIKWKKLDNYSKYNVYYKIKGNKDSTYVKINGELIRAYSDYFRADIIGLKPGTYQVKITPVSGTKVLSSLAAIKEVTVTAHTREGFAFSENSPFKTASGAYNENGTLKSDARVIYVTPKTAKTVKLDVVTNNKGKITPCTGLEEIFSARKKGYDASPLAVRFIGNLTASDMSGLNSKGYLEIKGSKKYTEMNITLEGVGDDATANGWGLLIRNAGQVEVRNLGFMMFPDDAISLDTANVNIWVHNNDFFYGNTGSDSDQAKGDGSLDNKGDTMYFTASYNHFWDSGKGLLCGMKSESGENYITYHHNYFDHSDSRHPRVRTMSVHFYNNYLKNNAKYGVGATMGANVYVEKNYFENCYKPMLISLQGTDIADGEKEGTFSGEDGGMIKAFDNIIVGSYLKGFIPHTKSSTNFDAYVAKSGNEKVSSAFKTLKGGNFYNNFDTDPAIMYKYTPDSPRKAKSNVIKYAGRINGGNIKFNLTALTTARDHGVVPHIKNALKNYKGNTFSTAGTGLGASSVNKNSIPTPPQGITLPEGINKDKKDETLVETSFADLKPANGIVHNFTKSGMDSKVLNISGNLSTKYGPISYNSLNLTQCLKIESITNISFNLSKSATLTMIFDKGDSGKKIKVDGTSYTIDSKGEAKISLKNGQHSITKDNSAYLFYLTIS